VTLCSLVQNAIFYPGPLEKKAVYLSEMLVHIHQTEWGQPIVPLTEHSMSQKPQISHTRSYAQMKLHVRQGYTGMIKITTNFVQTLFGITSGTKRQSISFATE